MPVARLRLRIQSHWTGADESGRRRVVDGMRTAGSVVGRIARGIGGAVRGILNMRSMAVIFAPAMFTLGKAALVVAAGLVTMVAVAGAAAAPWVALAVTAARNAEKMGAAGMRFQQGAAGVRNAWMDLARTTAGLTLGPLTNVLNGIAAAIPKLEPLVRDVAPTFAQVGRDLKAWLSGNGLDRLINNLRIAGVPAFRSLVGATRDTVATLGIGFRAFLPMAQQMSEDIEGSLAILRRRAEGGSFDRLLQNFRDDMPEVSRFLREAATTVNTIGRMLNDLGPGQLGALGAMLDLFNRIPIDTITAALMGYATGRLIIGLIPLLGAIALLRSMRIQFTVAFSLGGAASALAGAAGALFAMARAIQFQASQMRATTVNSAALDEIKALWDRIKAGGRASVTVSGAEMAQTVLMGVGSTWARMMSLGTITFAGARVDATVFQFVVAAIVLVWTAVRILALIPVVFRAMAVPGNALLAMAQIILAWTRVRTMAAVPATFRAMAIPGSVPFVGGSIIAIWAMVRALSLTLVVFRANASGGAAVSGSRAVIAAWRRVLGMARSWQGTARVNPGAAISGSNQAIAAWRSLLSQPRSWSAVASVTVNGGFGGLGAGGHVNIVVNNPYTGHPAVPFLPGRPPNPDFPDLGGFEVTGSAGGAVTGAEFDPGDFSGGFASGGPVSATSTGRGMGGMEAMYAAGQHIHIHDDVWIESTADLVKLLTEAVANAS